MGKIPIRATSRLIHAVSFHALLPLGLLVTAADLTLGQPSELEASGVGCWHSASVHSVIVTLGESHPLLGLAFPTNGKGIIGLGGTSVPSAAGQTGVSQSTNLKEREDIADMA